MVVFGHRRSRQSRRKERKQMCRDQMTTAPQRAQRGFAIVQVLRTPRCPMTPCDNVHLFRSYFITLSSSQSTRVQWRRRLECEGAPKEHRQRWGRWRGEVCGSRHHTRRASVRGTLYQKSLPWQWCSLRALQGPGDSGPLEGQRYPSWPPPTARRA
jgi:hypothetical protein